MSLFNAERLCMLCSYRSIELKQFGKVRKGVINAKTHQKTNTGLICTKCNGFVCVRCIEKIVPFMSSNCKHFISQDLYEHYKTAATMPLKTFCTPVDYIGHCCIVSSGLANPEVSQSEFAHPELPHPQSNQYSLTTNAAHKSPEPVETRNAVDASRLPPVVRSLSGCIFFPKLVGNQ